LAAADFARRKIMSGISRVVFTCLCSHIYGRGVNHTVPGCSDNKAMRYIRLIIAEEDE
jgi:hypothetical protein